MPQLEGIALALNQDGRLDVLATGQEAQGAGAIWHGQASSHGWSGWAGLGQPSGGALTFAGPAVARNADGRLEAAVVGEDLAVWHAWQCQPGGDWTIWHPLEQPGGKEVISKPEGARPPGPTPALAGNADGCLEIFVVRNDLTVWHRKQRPEGDWSDWASLRQPGKGTLGPLAAAANADGRLELFANDDNGVVCHCWQIQPNQDWSGWHSLGTPGGQSASSGLAAAQNQDGRLELFAVDAHRGAVWHRWQTEPNNGWSEWHSLGRHGSGFGFAEVAVRAAADGRLVLFATEPDSDRGLWQRTQITPGGDWSPWKSRAQALSFGVSAPGPIEEPTLALDENQRLQLYLRVTGSGDMYRLIQGANSEGAWASGWITF